MKNYEFYILTRTGADFMTREEVYISRKQAETAYDELVEKITSEKSAYKWVDVDSVDLRSAHVDEETGRITPDRAPYIRLWERDPYDEDEGWGPEDYDYDDEED